MRNNKRVKNSHFVVKCLLDDCGASAFRRGLCREHWGLAREDDVLHLVPTLTQRRKAAVGNRQYVYVMQSVNLCKVGISGSPDARLLSVRHGMIHAVELVFVLPVETTRAVEKAAHRLLDRCWVKGEWFECSPQVAIDAVLRALERPAEIIRADKRHKSRLYKQHQRRRERQVQIAKRKAQTAESLEVLKREFADYWATYDEVWSEPQGLSRKAA